MSNLIFVLFIAFQSREGVTPLLGGPKDKPIVWRAGGGYHLVMSETYWNKVLPSFEYESAPGGYANIDFVLLRFVAPEKYRYSKVTHGHLEFARKAQEYLHPKGLYMGYCAGIYNLKGSTGLGDINTQIITPGGVSLGVFCGRLPAYPYFSLSAGASLVTEKWDLTEEISGAPKSGSTESTGFWGAGRCGLLWQLRACFALDISMTYTYLTRRLTEGEMVPTTDSDEETLQELRVGIGLIFAMPWIVERTIY